MLSGGDVKSIRDLCNDKTLLSELEAVDPVRWIPQPRLCDKKGLEFVGNSTHECYCTTGAMVAE